MTEKNQLKFYGMITLKKTMNSKWKAYEEKIDLKIGKLR